LVISHWCWLIVLSFVFGDTFELVQEDINAFFGTDYSSEEADSIGGLVIQELGHLPVRGEKVVIGGLQFTVARADNRRLHTLMATKVK